MLDELRYEYPDELVPPGTTPTAYLRGETYQGAQRRYPRGIPNRVVVTMDDGRVCLAQRVPKRLATWL